MITIGLVRRSFARKTFIKKPLAGGLALATALLLAIAITAAGRGDTPEAEHLALSGGRSALMIAGGPARPAVIYLHAAGESAAEALRFSGFAETAARHGMAAVFGQSRDGFWGFRGFTGHDDGADEAYVLELRERLVARGLGPVYLAGMSNGGFAAADIACAHPGLFAGLGLIASGVPRRVGDLCREPPARFVAIVGDGDGVTPLAGGVGAAVFAGPLWGLTDMRRFAHIEGEGAHLSTPASGNARDATVYGEVGGPARIYIVHGGGHLVFNEDLWRRRVLPRRWLFFAAGEGVGRFLA